MSYSKHMFHRISDELQRIAERVEGGERVDLEDMTTALNAINVIAAVIYLDNLACDCLAVAASCNDMSFDSADAVKQLEETLMDNQGYQYASSDAYDVWVRRNY